MHKSQVVRLATHIFNNCWSHGPSIGIHYTLKIQIAFERLKKLDPSISGHNFPVS